jgi:hypothetical protein
MTGALADVMHLDAGRSPAELASSLGEPSDQLLVRVDGPGVQAVRLAAVLGDNSAPLRDGEQAARLAAVIARTGLDPWDAHVAARTSAVTSARRARSRPYPIPVAVPLLPGDVQPDRRAVPRPGHDQRRAAPARGGFQAPPGLGGGTPGRSQRRERRRGRRRVSQMPIWL